MVVSLKLKEAEDTGQYSLPLVYFPSLQFAGEPNDLVSIFHHPRLVEAEVTEKNSLLLTRNFLTGNKSHGGTFKSTADITLNQLRSSTFKMVPTLGELMNTLDKMPDEPQDYKPPFFWGCLENEAQYLLAKNPLRVEVGNVNSKRLVLTLKISHSQGNYLELTDVFSNFPLLSLAISEDIMDQLETDVVISETGKDTYVKNRDKGKSVLEPCENENDFMQDDGKRTRPVTKSARCKFFAEGFCPFGDECWFSHHVGGDGNSCCIFSCEASGSDSKGKSVLEPCENENYLHTLEVKKESEAVVGDDDTSREFVLGRCCWDTSVSKVFRKPALSLAGVKPPKKKKVTVKEKVHAYPNQTFTPSSLKTIFGPRLYNMCCSKEEPIAISCWFETYKTKADNSTYENQFLCWRSAKRSPNWRAGVTRVDRQWITLSEEDKNKVGPICAEQENQKLGAVGDQGMHQLCYAYVGVNLVSSLRVIDGVDVKFVNLSVRELCFYASPKDRLMQTSTEHKCHPLQVSAGLDYIKRHGVSVQRGPKEDLFDCIKDKPNKDGKDKIKIAGRRYLGNDLYASLKRLKKQPLGATVVLFSDYWDTADGEVYRGPKSDKSQYDGLHGVTVADAFLMDGELVFWCKSSHGEEYHTKGYILVSGEMIVMAHHFAAGSGNSTFGVNRGLRGGDTPLPLSSPTPLIHDFVYPFLESEKRKSNKRKR